jgi:rhomboid protease GluP
MESRPRRSSLVARFPATLAIAGITASYFAVQVLAGGADDPIVALRLGAMRADRVAEDLEVWRLAMPLLLHRGALHLVVDLFGLLPLAAAVEHLWGSRRLVLFYVACGIAAWLASAAFGAGGAGVGASGAGFGLAGLLLGASWYGDDSVRRHLDDLRPRLGRVVLLAFLVGWGLSAWAGIPVDHVAHAGGLVTGFVLAAAHPDPMAEPLAESLGEGGGPLAPWGRTVGFGVAVAVMVASIGASWIRGDRALATIQIDNARILAERVSRTPTPRAETLVEMLDWYARAGELDQGTEVYRRAVERFADPRDLRELLALLLTRATSGNDDRDAAIRATAERWVEIDGDNPDAFNSLAWHLVTAHDPARRDPVSAERLARQALDRIAAPSSDLGRRQRASYLDTLAEALYQQRRYAEALEVQHESVKLATELALEELPELAERLRKIEAAAG